MAKWNNGFTSIKKRGMLFSEWCEINGYMYMLDELDLEYIKNEYDLTLNTLTHGFDKKVRFVCSNGHDFYTKPVHRTNGQVLTCPYCRGSRYHTSDHSCAIDLKDLVEAEWDYERNIIQPENIPSSSITKFWWKCKVCGVSYLSSPHKRKNGRGCPYCRGLKVQSGVNDLATTHKYLMAEWDFEKNDINPECVTHGASDYVWWICPRGHSYSSRIYQRAGIQKSGCPICANTRFTSFPEQALYLYLSHAFTEVYNRYRGFGPEFDLYLPDEKVAVEFCGYNWHTSEEVEKRDINKANLAVNNGIYLIYILSNKDTRVEIISEEYYGLYIEMYCERAQLSSVNRMVYLVLSRILDRLGYRDCDLSFIDCERDFNTIMSMYYGTVEGQT